MVYHFVKHIGFDIKADSLEQAKEIAEAIDEYEDDYSGIKDVAYDTMIDAIDDALDVGVLREDFYDNCDAHVGKTEYAGYTDDEDDPEERLYDYLTEDKDEDDDDVRYVLTDKGRDWFAYLRGENPDYDESNYDEDGNRITPSVDDFVKILISLL